MPLRKGRGIPSGLGIRILSESLGHSAEEAGVPSSLSCSRRWNGVLTEQGVSEAHCLEDPEGYERYAREEGVGVVDGFFIPGPDIDMADI